MKRVSEVVTIDEINKWVNGDIITIKAGTGAGKSYFIKNHLYETAKRNNNKILMLIHRRNCVDQFQDELQQGKKTEGIDIKTYQYLETLYKNNQTFNFDEYHYIVADEFHYFMSDAAFNKTTDMSLNSILDQSGKIRIFMSATGDYMTKYIRDHKKMKTRDYEVPINFNFIRQLTFFNKDETLESFIDEAIEGKSKGIFFIQSAKKAYELYKKYSEHCLFNCSKNNEEYYKFVNEQKINNMLHDEKFDELILITTTCMDAGVNIKDKDVKHIVCDVKDISTLVQCIGRKRLETDKDKISLYIKTITNQQLGGIETQLAKKLEMARFLRKHTVQQYIEKYQREYDRYSIVYDDVTEDKDKCTKKVNELMYFKCLIDINQIHTMKKNGEFGYCKYLAFKFGFFDEWSGFNYRLIEEDNRNDELENYLESIVGKRLLKEGQKELIDMIQLKDGRGRIQKSIQQFNAYFSENKMGYLLVSKKTSKTENGQKKRLTYWEVLNNIIN
jgi:superfamily II DNA or RNA helicase